MITLNILLIQIENINLLKRTAITSRDLRLTLTIFS